MKKSLRILYSLKHHLELLDHNYISIMDLMTKKELINEVENLINEHEISIHDSLVGKQNDTDSKV